MPDAQGEAVFGQAVVAHRRRLGLTQEDLAAATGLSARAIRALEAGRVRAPRLSSVRLLADAFALAGEEREAFSRAAAGWRRAVTTSAKPSRSGALPATGRRS